jgi:MFS transporter, FHS family, L-fucose permease
MATPPNNEHAMRQINEQPNYRFAFVMITTLFFLWGFVHNLDPILIPHLKKSFSLTVLKSSLVDSAVFIAYFVMALPAGFLIKKYGYKQAIIIGLSFFAFGAYLFIPAANTQYYPFFLIALFVIACGLTVLETAANPYASLLGNATHATQRLNFAQSFNGLAATLAPIVGARLILTKGYSDAELNNMSETVRQAALASEASSVKLPYFVLGTIILLIGAVFYLLKLPDMNTQKEHTSRTIRNAWQHLRLRWAVAAQFFYVGAQVCVFSFFLLYAEQAANLTKVQAADYLGWGCGMGFMIGRFAGTACMKYIAPAKLLVIYASICIALSGIAIFSTGMSTVFSVIGIAFFMSIMFPTIFSLGIQNLGSDTAMGSSLLIMAIVGGAVLPPLFGYISDATRNIQLGYTVPLFCFVVIWLFAKRQLSPSNANLHAH